MAEKPEVVTEVHDVKAWLEENQKFFTPPICNKLMFKHGQLKVFFVGGPNSRKDFHMEEQEEFFYQLKGDMHLIVYEQDKFRDITIKEGEVFLLPRQIPHSPQRLENTIGLVIERERFTNDMDCLRYYIDGTDKILYEDWFHCRNLEELGPLIKKFFESEEYKTGKPVPGAIFYYKPIQQDFKRKLDDPFSLKDWIKQNEESFKEHKILPLFNDSYNSRISVLSGCHNPPPDFPETFLYQIEGAAKITLMGRYYGQKQPHSDETFDLKEHHCAIIPPKNKFTVDNAGGGKTLRVIMNLPDLDC